MSTLDMLSNQSLQPIQFRQGIEDTQHAVLTDIYHIKIKQIYRPLMYE